MSYSLLIIYFDRAVENHYRSELDKRFGHEYRIDERNVDLFTSDRYLP